MSAPLAHTTKVDGSLEADDPVSPQDVATKSYVDTTVGDAHGQDEVEEGSPGPTIQSRAGTRAIFVWWDLVDDAAFGHGYYQLQASEDGNFSTIIDDLTTRSSFSTFDGLDTTKDYYFRVRAFDAAGNATDWAATNDKPDEVVEDDLGDGQVSAQKFSQDLASDNYDGTGNQDGTQGWFINRLTGDVEFADGYFRGVLEAGGGVVVIGDDGIEITPGSGSVHNIRWRDPSTGTVYGSVGSTGSGFELIGDYGITIGGGATGGVLLDTGGQVSIQAGSNISLSGNNLTFNGNDVTVGHDHGTSGWTTSIDWQGGSGSGPNFTSNRNTDEFDTTDTTTGEVGSHNHSVPDHRHWVSL